ncbi:hypothetical protein [Nocardia paucivorans]|uniref:hypothetical protein n=1 Tax=Nocardia paucivorans TaxID=114259 RepID=UPI00030BE3FD|nr:hypothetical protein [Nocardia paucivorans]
MSEQLQQFAEAHYELIGYYLVTLGNAGLTFARIGFEAATPYLQAFFAEVN